MRCALADGFGAAQIGAAHQIAIDAAGALAALPDRPDDDRLAAARVSSDVASLLPSPARGRQPAAVARSR
jgi:hypothetical protein